MAEKVKTGNGIQGIRLFTSCGTGGSCDVYEDPARLHLAINRWYPTTVRLYDGSLLIMGGTVLVSIRKFYRRKLSSIF